MSCSPYEYFRMNETLENEGVWTEYPFGSFLLARAGGSNKRFTKRMEALTRPYRNIRGLDLSDMLGDDEVKELLYQIASETVILDWKDVKDADGKLIPFSAEAARKLFRDMPDLFSEIWREAQSLAVFRQEVLKVDAGNSSPA